MSSLLRKKSSGRELRRRELVENILMAGRESSAAAVMMHTVIAEKAGLTATDTKTIDTLLRLGPVTAGELARHTGLATASVTSLIDRLEIKGLVRRERDQKDRRRVIVRPVAERLGNGEKVFGAVRQGFAELLEAYRDDDLETILDFMRRSAQRTRELTADFAASSVSPFGNVRKPD